MSEPNQDDDAGPFKEWLTAAEMLALKLPGLPKSRMSMFRYATELAKTTPPHLKRWARGASSPSRRGPPRGAGRAFHYTCLPPEAVVAFEARFRPRVLAAAREGDRSLARLGKSVLAQAEGGQVRAFMLGVIAADPKASAARVRDLCEARFGAELTILAQGFPTRVPLPPLRTFQNFLAGLRAKESVQP